MLVALFLIFFSYSCLGSELPSQIEIPKSLHKKPPDQIKSLFETLKKSHSSPQDLLRLNYQKALLLRKKEEASFCKTMKELSQNKSFPLKDLALLKSLETCAFKTTPLFSEIKLEDFLKKHLALSFFKRSEKFDEIENLEAFLVLAEKTSHRKDKIFYLNKGIKEAKKLKAENEILLLQEALYKASPSLNPKPSPKDFFIVAEDFRRERKLKKAIHYYIQTLNSPMASKEDKHLSFKGLNQIYKIKKDGKSEIKNAKQWSDWLIRTGELKKYYNIRLDLARAHWNKDKNTEALKVVDQIIEDKKADVVRAEALHLRGAILNQEDKSKLSLKDWDRAIKILRKKRAKKEVLIEILWKKAWLLRKKGKPKKALNTLSYMENLDTPAYMEDRILFWKAKIYHEMNRISQAKKIFTQLIKRKRYGYYHMLALKLLDEPLGLKKPPDLKNLKDSLLGKESSVFVHWLILFKESDILSSYLDFKRKDFLSLKKLGEEGWLKFLLLLNKAKRHLEIFQSLELMDKEIRKTFISLHYPLYFPFEFEEEVLKASKKFSLPPALIYSIIRQESAFDKKARSLADAFGLMQLLPSTAREVARKNKIPYRNFRKLYDPSSNVLLGTAYLKKLKDDYKGQLIHMASSYNAGSRVVENWIKAEQNRDILSFIEDISYEETRTYVKLFVRNYIFYYHLLRKDQKEGEWFPKDLETSLFEKKETQ